VRDTANESPTDDGDGGEIEMAAGDAAEGDSLVVSNEAEQQLRLPKGEPVDERKQVKTGQDEEQKPWLSLPFLSFFPLLSFLFKTILFPFLSFFLLFPSRHEFCNFASTFADLKR